MMGDKEFKKEWNKLKERETKMEKEYKQKLIKHLKALAEMIETEYAFEDRIENLYHIKIDSIWENENPEINFEYNGDCYQFKNGRIKKERKCLI